MSFSVFSPLNEFRNRIVMADDGKREDPGNEAAPYKLCFLRYR